MDSYYANEVTSLPHFSGHYRQRGSGFGALAAGIGRVALPLARRFILPAAKRIGRELLKQGIPELVDVVSNKVTKTSLEKHSLKHYQKINRWTSATTTTKETNWKPFKQVNKTA